MIVAGGCPPVFWLEIYLPQRVTGWVSLQVPLWTEGGSRFPWAWELGTRESGVSVRFADVSRVSVRVAHVRGFIARARPRIAPHEAIVRREGEIPCKVMEKSFASIYKRLAVVRQGLAIDIDLW